MSPNEFKTRLAELEKQISELKSEYYGTTSSTLRGGVYILSIPSIEEYDQSDYKVDKVPFYSSYYYSGYTLAPICQYNLNDNHIGNFRAIGGAQPYNGYDQIKRVNSKKNDSVTPTSFRLWQDVGLDCSHMFLPMFYII